MHILRAPFLPTDLAQTSLAFLENARVSQEACGGGAHSRLLLTDQKMCQASIFLDSLNAFFQIFLTISTWEEHGPEKWSVSLLQGYLAQMRYWRRLAGLGWIQVLGAWWTAGDSGPRCWVGSSTSRVDILGSSSRGGGCFLSSPTHHFSATSSEM